LCHRHRRRRRPKTDRHLCGGRRAERCGQLRWGEGAAAMGRGHSFEQALGRVELRRQPQRLPFACSSCVSCSPGRCGGEARWAPPRISSLPPVGGGLPRSFFLWRVRAAIWWICSCNFCVGAGSAESGVRQRHRYELYEATIRESLWHSPGTMPLQGVHSYSLFALSPLCVFRQSAIG